MITLRHLAIVALVLLVAGAYHNSLSGEFVFDDVPAIAENPTIRALWPPSGPLSPPPNSGVGGRPLANLSFALNYAIHGTQVAGYHAGNVLLHLGSALLLFGIVRRTLQARSGSDGDRAAIGWAFVAAAAWSVHPLTTASVSYLSQRTEVLMGFFYCATLYAFIRGAIVRSGAWLALSVVACACGMMSKEVMVTAPVLMLLYDRTFIAGSLAEAWRRGRMYYAALVLTWVPLGYVLTTGLAQRSVGYGLGVSALDYAATEAGAILRYLRLVFVPQPLVFDYGPIYSSSVVAVLIVCGMIGLTLWATIRGGGMAFLAACFFLLLAPTSSIVPVAEQPMAENRMYLPLATVVVLGGCAIRAMIGRDAFRSRATVTAGCLLIASWASVTLARNDDYRSPLLLWTDTVAKRPENWRAHFNHGVTLLDLQRPAEAARAFERAIHLKPGEAKPHYSFGNALLELGRAPEAIVQFTEAVRLQPAYAKAWGGLGAALLRNGDAAAAMVMFERALQLEPTSAGILQALGNAFFQMNQPAKALAHYAAALRIDPALADAHYNAGSACLELGQTDEAIRHFTAAVKLKPADAEVRNNLGAALVRAGRLTEAAVEFEEAVKLKPNYTDARDNLDVARRELSRVK